MKVWNKLIQDISGMEGNMLGIGLRQNKILDAIEQNPHIQKCDLIESKSSHEGKTTSGSSLSISIYHLRKHFKKSHYHFIICNIEEIKPYQKYFLRDAFAIHQNKMYLYGKKKKDKNDIINRLQRYVSSPSIKVIEEENVYLIIVERKKVFLGRSYFYFIKDFIEEMFDQVSDILSH